LDTFLPLNFRQFLIQNNQQMCICKLWTKILGFMAQRAMKSEWHKLIFDHFK
jgi:hypothetical protein